MLKKYEDISKEENMFSGGRSCPGCGGGILTRLFLKELGGGNFVCPAVGSCGTNTTGMFPIGPMAKTGVAVTMLGAIGAAASGARVALDTIGKEDTQVLGIVGDGDAGDIGFGNVSAMVERGHKVCWVVVDNQGYSATGGQRSGLTPLKAWTRTTQSGKSRAPKILPFIFMAHNIPYTASASVAYPDDLYAKVKKALDKKNQPSLIVCLCPCIVNWQIEPRRMVEVARLAVETGAYPLYEYERGSFRRTVFIKERKPIQEYLKLQGRYAHVTGQDIKELEEYRDWLDRQIEGYLRFYSVEI